MQDYVCQLCGVTFRNYARQGGQARKFCSMTCTLRGRAHPGNRVNHATGPAAYRWKGDAVTYSGVHMWAHRNFKPEPACEHCGTKTAKRLEWANKTGLYRREREDWMHLCSRCHMIYDRNPTYLKILEKQHGTI